MIKIMNISKKSAVHMWVKKHFDSPIECEICKDKNIGHSGKLHWSNKDHKYSKKREDWQKVCVPCHSNYDRKMGFKKNKKNFSFIKNPKEFSHKCANRKTSYKWVPRIKNPKCCPACKTYL